RRGADQTPRLKCLWTLFHHEQRVEDDGFSQRHTEHRQRDYFAERAGIASHRLGSFHADEPHADSRTESAQADVNTPAHLRQHWRYHNFPFVMCWLLLNGSRDRTRSNRRNSIASMRVFRCSSSCVQINAVNTVVSSMNTNAWTSPTSISKK